MDTSEERVRVGGTRWSITRMDTATKKKNKTETKTNQTG
jgi:hypothetical protein